MLFKALNPGSEKVLLGPCRECQGGQAKGTDPDSGRRGEEGGVVGFDIMAWGFPFVLFHRSFQNSGFVVSVFKNLLPLATHDTAIPGITRYY